MSAEVDKFCESLRERRLSHDNNMIYALVAPRPLMMSTALHDPVENTWAIERFFEHIREVYELLGHPENMGQRYRPDPHAPDPDTYLAHSRFLVQASERKKASPRRFRISRITSGTTTPGSRSNRCDAPDLRSGLVARPSHQRLTLD